MSTFDPRFSTELRDRGAFVRCTASSVSGPMLAFALVHVVLAWIILGCTSIPMMWDVTATYRGWSDAWYQHGALMGIDQPWVYPVLALAPMLAVGAVGGIPYGAAWLGLVGVIGLVVLVPVALRSRPAAWWWVAFTTCLGPIALGRIDAIAVPLCVLAAVLVVRRPASATVLMTLAAWIKVWPAAMVVALAAAGRRRGAVVVAAAVTTASIAGIALLLGAGPRLLSPFAMQAGRGLQIESPAALPWMWLAHLRPDLASVYFDQDLITYQVAGPGARAAAAVMSPVLGVVCLLLLAGGWLAARRSARSPEVLALTSLGLVSALIGFNKVGSPQYITWLAAPVVLGLLVDANRFRRPALAVLVMAALTQAIYPWGYDAVMAAQPGMLVVLTVRDLLELCLVGWSAIGLLRLWHPSLALPRRWFSIALARRTSATSTALGS